MKLIMALMVLSISSNVFAEGAWELKCSSNEGISLYVANGISEMKVLSDDKLSNTKTNIIVEDYDNGVGNDLEIKWSGKRQILADSLDNVDGHDLATTIFTQKALIQNFGVTIATADMTCSDLVITSSGSDESSALDEQI